MWEEEGGSEKVRWFSCVDHPKAPRGPRAAPTVKQSQESAELAELHCRLELVEFYRKLWAQSQSVSWYVLFRPTWDKPS